MQLDCFLGTKDNAPSSTLSVGNQFTKVMFELFLSSWHFLSRYIFLLSKCLQYKFKTDLRRKITHFPLCLLLEFLFCYFGLHRCHEKNERPYDFNLRQNTPMGVTSRGRDLKNFKSRALLVQWRQILCEIAFQILLR